MATWDGKVLKVMEIVWPGNSSFPPKGVPERYHLDVATYIEEPHVTFEPLGPKGQCDPLSTICKVYERDESDNRSVVTDVPAVWCTNEFTVPYLWCTSETRVQNSKLKKLKNKNPFFFSKE